MLKQDNITVPEFTRSDASINELLDLMHEIADLSALGSIAEWDQNTAMPAGATQVRGFQMATIKGVLHERWTSSRLGDLLGELPQKVQKDSFSDADRGLVREALRGYERATKLPRKLVEEIARVQAGSFDAWRRARENNDFASFAPWLSRTVALEREVADRLGFVETRYDALLDEYEPGMTTSKLDALFKPVRETSKRLLQRIEASGNVIDASCLEGEFPVAQQVVLSERVLRDMGYDFSRGQVAQSPHPFTTSFGSPFDVRLTVHPDKHYLQPSVMAAIHGDVAVESLPRLWNAKYREYLGVEPANDAQGVLQDIHWTSGFGYFPTYTLGNLFASQIFHTLQAAFPDFDSRLASGDTSFILTWLREHMYAVGAIYLPEDLMLRVTGEVPNPEYFTRYLTNKFEKIYNLSEID